MALVMIDLVPKKQKKNTEYLHYASELIIKKYKNSLGKTAASTNWGQGKCIHVREFCYST